MKYIYTFYIWTVGILLFVIIASFSILILKFIPAKKFSPIFKSLTRFLVKALLIRVEVSGLDNFTKEDSCIIMSNHVSFLDAPLLTAFTPFYSIGIEDQTHFNWPIFGTLIRMHGNLSINRGSVVGSRKTYEIAQQKLNDWAHLIIFPEGGRTDDGKLKPLKKLPFMLAKNANCEIIPLAINGIYEMNNKNSFLMNPIKIRMQYGKPISSETVEILTINELLEHTRTKMTELLDKRYS